MAQSSSSSTIGNKREKIVLCHCNRKTKVIQAWTDTNPGRRFYTCVGRKVSTGYESCDFFRWYDVKTPHGWQYTALLAARDVMNQQRDEIRDLRNQVRALSLENEGIGLTPDLECEACEAHKRKVEALEKEVLVLNERRMVYRNALIASSIGVTVVIGVFMGISKWKKAIVVI
ncbi:hypothetical protein Rs2_20507 [Raphanus sativus]|uniref:Uncharacterized protein LOC108858048 n=1 Tax=Raphanus sativus TaxID=3726 RepID=A0A6J0NTT5_RAPSA|nr:uncharacterized protein LOC108858048 [Raphanus sativus]KAJ4893713.1 hypothetical protein Rs2_20507 [Raphanus sativus]